MDLWTYEFDLVALNELHFASFNAPSFRGGFGSVLRQLTCVTRMPDCELCPVKTECPFTFLFNTPPPENDTYFAGQTQVPRPFVLDTPDVTRVSHGQHVRFRISLAGKANEYLPYVVLAYRQLGIVGIGKGRGRYKLASVSSVDPLGRRLPVQVFNADENKLFPSRGAPVSLPSIIDSFKNEVVSRIRIHFTSPTHLNSKGRAPHEPPEFETLIRAVLRRYSDLAHLYGEGRPQLDYRSIVEGAKTVRLCSSNLRFLTQLGYSQRKESNTPTAGLTGSVTYEGELSEYMPFLVFAQWLHIGKQATFGMGRYQVEIAA